VAGQKQIPVRIITPRGRAAEAAAARTATPEILARLEQYTGIPYPWEKLDHIAVLDLPFGATENPGLITYRDHDLLAPSDRDTPRRQRLMRETMAHELAHQWFGNLVTQAGWTDVWLSEGFATWLGTKVSDMELPPFERGLVITDTRDRMMASDSAGARVVRLEMHSRKEMENVYAGIVYAKGAAILKMLEDWVGPGPFQKSLHRYLIDHQFDVATSLDLAQAIEQESGIDAAPVLFSFLDRPGVPLLHFKISSRGTSAKLEVEQGPQPWTVPVCYHSDGGERQCEVVSRSHSEVPLSRLPAWVWPNAYGGGYYRSLLTADNLGELVKNGYPQLDDLERLALMGDLEGLTRTGDAPAAEIMKIMPRMARNPEARTQVHLGGIALQLAMAAPGPIREKYAAWLEKTMGVAKIVPQQAQGMEEFFRDKQ
jgi:cytosol alanyl aminopeptidase